MQEFGGVDPAYVVVYGLDTPVVVCRVAKASVAAGSAVSLGADFTASNPEAGQGVSGYQVYGTNAADALTVSGVANRTATSAGSACSVSSLAGLGLVAAAPGTDTIEVRASNGSDWGDWTALAVNVIAPVTAAAALAAGGTAQIAVADTAANIAAAAGKLQPLAASGRLVALSVTGGGMVAVPVAALASEQSLLSLLPAGALQVAGATAGQAAALQANAQVGAFSVTDSAASVTAARTALAQDAKLTAIAVTGTGGADTLDLTGVQAAATIDLSGNAAKAVAGLSASRLAFIGAPDAVTLGGDAATVAAGLGGGIATIANFQLGLDTLRLGLGGASAVSGYDTSYNGAHAIALTGAGTATGVVLINQPASLTAASLLSGHVITTNGVATVH